jgi:hypothetical protein
MFSLSSSPVHVIEIVSTHNRLEVALVDNAQWNLWVELTKPANFTVLLRDEPLGEHGQLNEEMVLGQIEVRSKPSHRDAVFVPRDRELEGLVDPLVTVDGEELRE